MTPTAVVHILNEITVNKKHQILELGMGVSTLCILAMIKQGLESSLISVDHDAEWIHTCNQQIQGRDLWSTNHHVIHAPLVTDRTGQSPWYETSKIFSVPHFMPDMLVIDGPPAWQKGLENARIPVFHALSSRLSKTATVVIDDFNRSGERTLLNMFTSSSQWNLVLTDELANIAILRRAGTSAYNAF